MRALDRGARSACKAQAHSKKKDKEAPRSVRPIGPTKEHPNGKRQTGQEGQFVGAVGRTPSLTAARQWQQKAQTDHAYTKVKKVKEKKKE